MPIKTLTALKKNPVITELNYQQSEYDNKDKEILSSNFTRSPVHAVTFLIVYAGLNEEQRQYTLKNLNNKKINKEELDNLILDIDWPSVLKSTDISSTLKFEFSIGIANKAHFFNAVKDKCSGLYQALAQNNCIVNIEETDRVVFTTKISQNELWMRPFDRDDDKDFWTVPEFKLSASLNKTIQGLAEAKSTTTGAFHIKKGSGKWVSNVELHILAPHNTNEFSIENKINVNPGIYNAFVGLGDFYGLDSVDDVTVELESNAKFSDKGASASQTQVVTFFEECAMGERIDKPTIITVKDLHVLFKGADIVANFAKPSRATFNESHYIELPTQSTTGTGISLFAHMPSPKEAFLLHLEKDQASKYANKKEPSTIGTFFNSWFGTPNEQETTAEKSSKYVPN